MTDLERKALLGDRKAQEECTRQGILLPCPFCGGDFDAEFNGVMFKMERTNLYAHKRTGRCVLDGEIIFDLSDWNTRPAPPIGRCGECEHWYKGHCSTGPCATEETDADFYCSNFKQDTKQGLSKQRDKEGEENAAD